MPFKVMIVDDEIIVRKGIMTSIDWPEQGIEMTAEAKNGEDALMQLANCPVDLVLTDIRMPVMNGIELAARVKTGYPDTEVVMLSGYEDFQYAKEAMAIGIRHYLLKPVTAEKLIATLSQLRDLQQAKRLAQQGERIRNTLFNENLPLIKSRLMSRLIHHKTDGLEIADQARSLHLHLAGPFYQICVMEIDDFVVVTENLSPREQESYTFAVLNVAEETLQSHCPGFVSYGEPGKLVGIANVGQGESASPICEEIRSNLLQYLKLSVSIGIGQPAAAFSDIPRSYREAILAVGEKALITEPIIGRIEENGKRIAKRLVKEAVRFIGDHYGEPIALSDVAQHVQVTPPHLSKVFKEEMGVTFVKWLNHYRMEEAKRLLKSSWLKTYEIADKVGFTDYKYFSMMFKQHTGRSPREYRNQ